MLSRRHDFNSGQQPRKKFLEGTLKTDSFAKSYGNGSFDINLANTVTSTSSLLAHSQERETVRGDSQEKRQTVSPGSVSSGNSGSYLWQLIVDHLSKESASGLHIPAPIEGLHKVSSEEIPIIGNYADNSFGSECKRILGILMTEMKAAGLAPVNYLTSESHIETSSPSPISNLLEPLSSSKTQGHSMRNTGTFSPSITGTISQQDNLSSLSRILYPHVKTREGIDTLLRRASPIQMQDRETTEWVFQMAREPMWSPSYYPDVSHTLAINPISRKLRTATINELVEMMTPVHITPHQSIHPSSWADLDEFCNDMYLCYQHFITPYGLLAKLFQRFFVPSYIPFHENYVRHGYYINVRDSKDLPTLPLSVDPPGGGHFQITKTTSLWMAVMKKTHIRVAAVIAEWSRKHPSHFDPLMRDVTTTWLWECCSGPVLWSDSPSELYCCAEAIRANLLENPNKGIELRATYRDSNVPPTLWDTHNQHQTSGGGNRKGNDKALSGRIIPEDVGLSFPSQVSMAGRWSTAAHDMRASGRLPTKSDKSNLHSNSFTGGNNNSKETLKSSIQDFLKMNTKTVAVLMSAIDMQAFRTVSTSDLFQLATTDVPNLMVGNVGTREVPPGVGKGVRVMMTRFECTTQWLLNALMDAIELDVNSSKGWRWATDVLKHVTTFAYRLVKLNNFHSTFAVVAALVHPVFSKIYYSILSESVAQPLKKNIEELVALFDFTDGVGEKLRKYVTTLPDSDMYPVIPVLQQWASELRMVENNQPSILIDARLLPTIHWRKMKVITGIYRQLIDYQAVMDPPEYSTDGMSVGTLLWVQKALAGPFRTRDELIELNVRIIEEVGKGELISSGI